MFVLGFLVLLITIDSFLNDKFLTSYIFNVMFHTSLVIASVYNICSNVTLIQAIREYLFFDLIKMFFSNQLFNNKLFVIHHVFFGMFCYYWQHNDYFLQHTDVLCLFEVSSIFLNLKFFVRHYYFRRNLWLDFLFASSFVYFRIFYGIPKLISIVADYPGKWEYFDIFIIFSASLTFVVLHIIWSKKVVENFTSTLKNLLYN